MSSFIFAIDMDMVLADTNAEILRRYNRDWNDDLTYEEVTEWKISTNVKPECGLKAVDYYRDTDLYDYVQPMEGAKEAVDMLRRNGHTVIVATSCFVGTELPKIQWLLRHKLVDSRHDIVIADRKNLIAADILIDDKPEHITQFPGFTMVFDHPYNRHVDANYRLKGWKDDGLNAYNRL